jgi:phage gp36-like protein
VPYSSKEDIIAKIPENFLVAISDLDLDGQMDITVINAAIEEVDGEIDGRLESEYSVPFDPVPVQIKWISAWCAIAKMAHSRGIPLEAGWAEEIQRKKEELDRYASGEDLIPGLSSKQGGGPIRIRASAIPKFTVRHEDIDGNLVNTDEIDDDGIGTLDAT